jgi:hypothetical protein
MGIAYIRLSQKAESQHGSEYQSLKRANDLVADDFKYAYKALTGSAHSKKAPAKKAAAAKHKRK